MTGLQKLGFILAGLGFLALGGLLVFLGYRHGSIVLLGIGPLLILTGVLWLGLVARTLRRRQSAGGA